MTDTYCAELLRVAVAQIAQTIGYISTQAAPLEILQDVLQKFILEFARDLHNQTEHANRVEPNLRDAHLSMKSLHINVHELLDYIGNVEPVPCAREVPAFPLKRASNMNFLKPGSAETLTRPVHIYEYLPPMLTAAAEPTTPSAANQHNAEHEILAGSALEPGGEVTLAYGSKSHNWQQFELKPDFAAAAAARAGCQPEDEAGSTREISSVVMTTGGFISPAIEGKLPEVFVPHIIEKFKGLDAPPASPPAQIAGIQDCFGGAATDAADVTSAAKDIKNLAEQSDAASTTTIAKQEPGTVNPSGPALPTIVANVKPTKRSKKQRHLAAAAGLLKDGDLTTAISSKAQEKAQRKALKMFHKLTKSAKNQNEAVKKSKKHLNRVAQLSALPDGSSNAAETLQFEKLLKKQARQRQKQLKGQKQLPNITKSIHDPFDVKSKFENTIIAQSLNAEEIAMAMAGENSVKAGLLPALKITQIEDKQDIFASAAAAAASSSATLSEEIKLSTSPDRSKLNIFKKLTKQKAPKAPLLALNVPNQLFGSGNDGGPLISLPSGTTITPAPPSDLDRSTMPLPLPLPINMPLAATALAAPLTEAKPKKRGRKPGSKNQTKIQVPSSAKQVKQNHQNQNLNALPFAITLPINQTNQPMDQPINLSSQLMQQLKGEDVEDSKPKKVRKKYKSKYNSLGLMQADMIMGEPHNKKLFSMDGPPTPLLLLNESASCSTNVEQMQISPGKAHGLANLSQPMPNYGRAGAEATISHMPYASNQPALLPMLPLLHFPPRPGLIPSGPGLGLLPTLGGLPMPSFANMPAFMPFAAQHSRTIMEQQQQDKQAHNLGAERGSYCNVAPLVPAEAMKLMTDSPLQAAADAKFKFAPGAAPAAAGTGNLGDPIEVSDDSDESQAKLAKVSTSPLPSFGLAQASKSHLIQPPQLPYGAALAEHSAPTLLDYAEPKKPKKKSAASLKLQPGTTATDDAAPSPFNLSFMAGGSSDKFSLAGGADLIPLSRLESGLGLAYSARTVPATSLAAGATSGAGTGAANQLDEQPIFVGSDDLTITPALSHNLSMSELNRLRKEHKKLKKPKEGKIKKKKDKKDKSKNRERSSDRSERSPKGSGELEKKPKKEKKKDRQAAAEALLLAADAVVAADTDADAAVEPKASKPEQQSAAVMVDRLSPLTLTPSAGQYSGSGSAVDLSAAINQVPKLTLKLGGKSTPTPLPFEERESNEAQAQLPAKRDQSPELARFSPLVTGPPKPKPSDVQPTAIGLGLAAASLSSSSHPHQHSHAIASMPMAMPMTAPSSGWLSAGGTLAASSVLLPQQLLQVPQPTATLATAPGNINSPLATVGAASPAAAAEKTADGGPALPQISNAESNRPSSYVDAEGNRIWICPACGKVDDGSAMIGCDGCDAWYHWLCVGIFVAPKDNEDWFCRVCITRKKVHSSDKKKKRNKKKGI